MNPLTDKNAILLPWVTVPEAAKFLGISRKMVYQLIEFDQITAVREKGAVLIEQKSLENFQSSGKRI